MPRTRCRTLLRPLVLGTLGLALLGVPAVAEAAVLTGPMGMQPDLLFQSQAGETHDIELRSLPAGTDADGVALQRLQIDDRRATITSNTDLCRIVNPHRAVCVVGLEVPTFILGEGADRLTRKFAEADHVISVGGNGGDDRLLGLAGARDELHGGAGNDVVRGDPGTVPSIIAPKLYDDLLDGGLGADYVRAGHGHDHLSGGLGADRVLGGEGRDLVFGDTEDHDTGVDGNDDLEGGGGADHIEGNAGSDRIRGGDGDDRLLGEHDCAQSIIGCRDPGRDRIEGDAGADVISSGAGGVHALTRDLFRDTVTCLGGDDRVDADPLDVVSEDCDTVFIGLPPLVR